LSFHHIREALEWKKDLDLGILELVALITISVKEVYASSESSENLRKCEPQPKNKIVANWIY